VPVPTSCARSCTCRRAFCCRWVLAAIAAVTERTSFKTKFLDYLALRNPSCAGDPSTARQCAMHANSIRPRPALLKIQRNACNTSFDLAANPDRQARIVANAGKDGRWRFNPETIHRVSSASFNNLIEQRKHVPRDQLREFVPAPLRKLRYRFNGPLIAPWIDFIGHG